ncbi:hypothetical protein [uncultured Roseibium sp.]|uniref:hypothetical protein n=1 Tax=uncultured Roseibium sp. TaxID=1936171 RepID=UPI0025984098|nr:hypothetical protein [uncultured Roseibium sp.]
MNSKELHKAHMRRLHQNAQADLKRHLGEKTAKQKEREETSDRMSAAWNKRQLKATPITDEPLNDSVSKFGDPLPENWRGEHWKTLQSWAEEFAGTKVSNKAEAVAALEIYAAELAASE